MASSSNTTVPSSDVPEAHTFYNNRQEPGLQRRDESKIIYLRNFNNWIKSTLIEEYLQRIKREHPERKNSIHVFDMGCGKGGDQLKWKIGRVKSVTFSDLAGNSVNECKERYNGRCATSFQATFFPMDCTKESIREKMETNEPCFDLVSTQFVLHYAFEKLESADRFLRNAAELLREGGYFIGTTINSCQLVERCRKSPDQSISNDVFSIKFDPSIDLSTTSNEAIPLFGAKYHFSLDENVNCPEWLVYFPLLVKLAEKHGLEKVDRQTFKDYFDIHEKVREGSALLKTMKALERYELPTDDSSRPPIDHSQYVHGKKYIDDLNENQSSSVRSCRTLSQREWDMTSLYIIFAFKKVRHIIYDEDKPISE